jgi:arginine/lysine/ornithine decarboxylase
LKQNLSAAGFSVLDTEPLKITISAKSYGYTGEELSRLLYQSNIVSEFSDSDFLVLMPSSDTDDCELDNLLSALCSIPKREPIHSPAPVLTPPPLALSPRDAVFSPCEEVAVDQALGRVLAAVTISCPPAVPILVSGEVVSEEAIATFKYYGIKKIKVIK